MVEDRGDGVGERPMRRGRRPLVAGLVAVLVLVLAVTGAVALTRRDGPAALAGRTSVSSTDLVQALGAAVARQGSGRAVTTMQGPAPAEITVRFALRGGHVDGIVSAAGLGTLAVVEGGVARPVPPGPASGSSSAYRSGLQLTGLDALVRGTAFQDGRTGAALSTSATWSRASAGDDGTRWTASWTDGGAGPGGDPASVRHDGRVTVDAAGLPVEVRITLTPAPAPGSPGVAVTTVTRYDQWGQPVDVRAPAPLPPGVTSSP